LSWTRSAKPDARNRLLLFIFVDDLVVDVFYLTVAGFRTVGAWLGR
jgi:hypothetical protein